MSYPGRMIPAPDSKARPAAAPSRARLVAALALGLWALYVTTASPGVGWYDAGELVAGAHTLGVAHPTGFPLWALLAKAAALVPVGSVALRVTLLGAASLVVAALLAGELAARWVEPRLRAQVFGVAALAVGLASSTWRHATSAEVYCLHLALVAGLALGVERLAARPSARGLATLGLVAGLGLANHGELRLLGLALAAGTVVATRRSLPVRAWLWGVAAGAVGLATYLYLPLRAMAGAAHLWDEVQHVDRLWAHVTAQRILLAFRQEMWQLTGPRAHLYATQLAERVWTDVGPLLLLVPVGAALLLRPSAWRAPGPLRRRGLATLLVVAGMGSVDLAYSFLVNPMGLRDVQVGQVAVWAAAVLAAVGAGRLVGALQGRRATRGGAEPAAAWATSGGWLVAALWLAVAGGLAHGAVADLRDKAHSGQVAPAAFATAGLDRAAPHAVVLTTSDSLSAGLLHGRLVEGARPDIRHGVRQHLWSAAGRRHVAHLLPKDSPATALALVRAQLGHLPLRWEPGAGEEEPPLRAHLVPGLPTWRLVAEPLRSPLPAIDLPLLLDELRSWEHGSPLTDGGRQAWAEILNYAGWHEAGAGRWEQATVAFDAALAVHPGSSRALNNLSVVASQRDDVLAALRWSEAALAVNPASRVAQVNRGRYALALRRLADAHEAFDAALALDPRCVPALAGLGAVVANEGDLAGARDLLERAIEIDPEDAEARANLAQVMRALGRPDRGPRRSP